jgi:hypothetical protein
VSSADAGDLDAILGIFSEIRIPAAVGVWGTDFDCDALIRDADTCEEYSLIGECALYGYEEGV